MGSYLTRRGFCALGASTALPVLARLGTGSAHAQAVQPRFATLMPGISIILESFIRHQKLDVANNVNLKSASQYTSVQTYYNDFDVGNYDVCFGSWDTFAVRYLAGVPCKFLCSLMTGDTIKFVGQKSGGVDTIKGMHRHTIAAPQSTGTYRIARALLREKYGFDMQTEASVQKVPGPAAAMTLLRSGSADVALAWEPNITAVTSQDSRLAPFASVGTEYSALIGKPLPYIGIGVRTSLLESDPSIGMRLGRMFQQCIEGILADTDGAARIVGDRSGFSEQVLKDVLRSRSLSLAFAPMWEESGRDIVRTAAKFCARNELLAKVPDDAFFITK